MSNVSNADYIASIEQSVSVIDTKLDSSVVRSVFERYGAHGIEDLNPSDLPEVFSDLYAIEADLAFFDKLKLQYHPHRQESG